MSFVAISFSITIFLKVLSHFEFLSCHNLSFVTNWVLLQNEFCHKLSFVTIRFLVLSPFIMFFLFCHNFSFCLLLYLLFLYQPNTNIVKKYHDAIISRWNLLSKSVICKSVLPPPPMSVSPVIFLSVFHHLKHSHYRHNISLYYVLKINIFTKKGK